MRKLAGTHARATPRRPCPRVEPIYGDTRGAGACSSVRRHVEDEAGAVLLVLHGVTEAQRGQLELSPALRPARPTFVDLHSTAPHSQQALG